MWCYACMYSCTLFMFSWTSQKAVRVVVSGVDIHTMPGRGVKLSARECALLLWLGAPALLTLDCIYNVTYALSLLGGCDVKVLDGLDLRVSCDTRRIHLADFICENESSISSSSGGWQRDLRLGLKKPEAVKKICSISPCWGNPVRTLNFTLGPYATWALFRWRGAYTSISPIT